jgi:hypothetical protein
MITYRVDDILPQLGIQVVDGGQVQNLETLDVFVRWQKPDGTEIPERQAVVGPDPSQGIANYVWVDGDLNLQGFYRAIIQLSPEGNPDARYSLTNPPLVEIEVLSNDFAGIDQSYPMLPMISGEDVAVIMGVPVSSLDSARLIASIDRGRMLTYTYGEMWKCPGLVLDPQGIQIAKMLEASLAAREYTTNPLVVFGPYKKETFGSYSYEMKETNVMSTRQQTGGATGIPNIDAMIGYLQWLVHGCGMSSDIDIVFPDWRQPLTEPIFDPSVPVQ